MKRGLWYTVLGVVLGFFVDAGETAPAQTLFWRLDADALPISSEAPKDRFTSPAIEEHITSIMESMSAEQRVAQLLMISWRTPEPTPEVMRWIEERNIGGVKVFGWNGKDLPTLARAISTMQRASVTSGTGVPLFTATDQEGGSVRHVKGATSITPGNMAIGASRLPYDAYMSARYIGYELRALGINMNFAPTVDVYRNPDDGVIGSRAFSSDPVDSGLLGIAYYHGLREARVMATAKHFPGHGNASGDSHGHLPVINDDYQTVWDVDLLPFRMLIQDGVPAVLSGHLSFPQITGTNAPASISPYFKQRILRDELDFQGVVITDDLHMGGALDYGAAQGWSFARLVQEAIAVGNDVVMFSQTPPVDGEVWQTLLGAYLNQVEFRHRVDESVRRILRVKLTYLLPNDRVPLEPPVEAIDEAMRTEDAQRFFRDQAARSITEIGSKSLPLTAGERAGSVLLVGNDSDFLRAGRNAFPNADTLRSVPSPRELERVVARYDITIFLLNNARTLTLAEGGRDYADRFVVYSSLTPIYLADLPWIERAVAVYGWGIESFEAGFSTLIGELPAMGTLPIDLSTFMRSPQ